MNDKKTHDNFKLRMRAAEETLVSVFFPFVRFRSFLLLYFNFVWFSWRFCATAGGFNQLFYRHFIWLLLCGVVVNLSLYIVHKRGIQFVLELTMCQKCEINMPSIEWQNELCHYSVCVKSCVGLLLSPFRISFNLRLSLLYGISHVHNDFACTHLSTNTNNRSKWSIRIINRLLGFFLLLGIDRNNHFSEFTAITYIQMKIESQTLPNMDLNDRNVSFDLKYMN